MIGIVDYGIGNIQAYLNLFKKNNIGAIRVKSSVDILKSTHLILPGVGSFDRALQKFNSSGLKECLKEHVLVNKTPLLGVCVGLQILGYSSEEGNERGLHWIPGKTYSFRANNRFKNYRVPHMGWNTINKRRECSLLENIDDNARFYFLHSYYFLSSDISHRLATSSYSIEFDCMVFNDNIYGVQFHPEKSHSFGEQLLLNFVKIK